MKFLHAARVVLAAILAPAVAVAHPGHDGHELTWEFAGAHVHVEWVLGALALSAITVGAYRYARRRG